MGWFGVPEQLKSGRGGLSTPLVLWAAALAPRNLACAPGILRIAVNTNPVAVRTPLGFCFLVLEPLVALKRVRAVTEISNTWSSQHHSVYTVPYQGNASDIELLSA